MAKINMYCRRILSLPLCCIEECSTVAGIHGGWGWGGALTPCWARTSTPSLCPTTVFQNRNCASLDRPWKPCGLNAATQAGHSTPETGAWARKWANLASPNALTLAQALSPSTGGAGNYWRPLTARSMGGVSTNNVGCWGRVSNNSRKQTMVRGVEEQLWAFLHQLLQD